MLKTKIIRMLYHNLCTYRGFIYEIMLWRHYYEEINNGCWSSAVTENSNQILVAKVAESAEIYHRLSAVCKSETLVWWDMGSSYMPENQWWSVQWKHVSSPSPEKFICRQGYGLCFLGQTMSCSCELYVLRMYCECRFNVCYWLINYDQQFAKSRKVSFFSMTMISPHSTCQTVQKIE